LLARNEELAEHVRSLSIRVGLAAFAGTIVGMLVMYCVMRDKDNIRNRDEYEEIPDDVSNVSGSVNYQNDDDETGDGGDDNEESKKSNA
jgi:hypothetical protein